MIVAWGSWTKRSLTFSIMVMRCFAPGVFHRFIMFLLLAYVPVTHWAAGAIET
jgi:hypothetical protein